MTNLRQCNKLIRFPITNYDYLEKDDLQGPNIQKSNCARDMKKLYNLRQLTYLLPNSRLALNVNSDMEISQQPSFDNNCKMY